MEAQGMGRCHGFDGLHGQRSEEMLHDQCYRIKTSLELARNIVVAPDPSA